MGVSTPGSTRSCPQHASHGREVFGMQTMKQTMKEALKATIATELALDGFDEEQKPLESVVSLGSASYTKMLGKTFA